MQPVLLSKRKFISVIFMALLDICAVFLLFYPVQYIGMAQSPNINYTGAAVGLQMWVQAVVEAVSAKPLNVQRTLLHQTTSVPEGIFAIDTDTRHLWKNSRIGKIGSDGQFDIVWDAGRPLDPAPYPSYRMRDEWKRLLQTADGNLS